MGNTPLDPDALRQAQIAAEALRIYNEELQRELETKEKLSDVNEQTLRDIEYEIKLRQQENELREKLRKFDVGSLGLIGAAGRLLKNNVDHAKEMAKLNKQINNYTELRDELDNEINRRHPETDKALISQLEKKKALYNTEIGINQQLAAAGGRANIFGNNTARIGAAMSSGVFQAGLFISKIFLRIASLLWGVIKGVLDFMWNRMKDVFNVFLEFQRLAGNLAADLGLSNVQTELLYNNIRGIGQSALKFGVSMEEAFGFMRKFAEATGINRVFLKEEIEDLSAIAKATGLGVEATGEMYAKMELLGFSTSTFHKYVTRVRGEAVGLNLNIGKLLKTVSELQPAFRGLNFREGFEGLTKIIEKAQGLRFNLENMRSLANKVFNPEGAVELAAQLRILGGSFARIADPFALMMKGQTDAAGLMDDVISTLSGLATKNKEGIFTIPPVQQALIREAAAAMGENADNMIQGAIQMAKQQDILSRVRMGSLLTKDDRTLIANLAELEGNEYVVRVNAEGLKVAVQNLTPNMLANIKKYRESEELVARNRMDIMEQLRNLYQQFLVALAPVFQKIYDALTKSSLLKTLGDKMIEFGNWLGAKIEGVINGGTLSKFFDNTKVLIESLVGLMTGNGTFMEKLGSVIGKVLEYALKSILPTITTMLRESGVGSVVKETAGIFGGLGGAALGTTIAGLVAALIPGIGPFAAAAILGGGALLGGGAGYGIAKGTTGSILAGPKVQDVIYRPKGKPQSVNFADTDTIIGYDASKTTAMMTPRMSPLEDKRFPKYDKRQFAMFQSYMSAQNTGPTSMNLSIGGVLKIEGERATGYLTRPQLENVAWNYLANQMLVEQRKLVNYNSSKVTQDQVITPLA